MTQRIRPKPEFFFAADLRIQAIVVGDVVAMGRAGKNTDG
jgi:hypothetical protein